jgi:Lon protease-like protein
MIQENLPLFPLNLVLFPGAPLTLHIFEERYRLMISRCLEDDEPFGVVFIRRGSETGEVSDPYPCGTIARINASVYLEDGRFLIATVGEQRFRVKTIHQAAPYMVASVHMLTEDITEIVGQFSEQLKQTYFRYWQAITAATGMRNQIEQLPNDAIAIAYHLAHRMQVTNERKQHWLETDALTRIRELIFMLQSEMSLLPRANNRSKQGTQWTWSWN